MNLKRTGITSIYLENFKGISEPVKIPLKPITLLFGANSAGKSTIIQAIHYAIELIDRNNPDADFTKQGGNIVNLGGYRNLINKHDIEKSILIGFEITPDDYGLPNYGELFNLENSDFYDDIVSVDYNDRINDFRIDFKVSFDDENFVPWLSEVNYYFNSELLVKVVVDKISTKPYLLDFNTTHNIFNKLPDEIVIDEKLLGILTMVIEKPKSLQRN